MSGLAAIIQWDDPTVGDKLVERMLDRVPHRSTEGHAVLSGEHCALGHARHAATTRERREVQPLRDAQRGLWVVANARLDNRDELSETLQGTGCRVLSDPEILLLGYERWGTELAGHLVGDFAFAIWDLRRRELYAARDPFGVRPLYYHAGPKQLAIASEVEPILALDGVRRDIDDQAVLDYLLCTHQHHRRTFFRGVTRLAPGHFLWARHGSVREVRYWQPPATELRLQRAEEYHEEFRRLFQLAVADRLDADRPLVAQLSGGLDSSAIVCVAGEIYRRTGEGRPPLRLASAVYPGCDTDETPFIDAVAQSVLFPSERYDGMEWDPTDEEVFHVAHPWREARPGISTGWRRIALREGARVVLGGIGGDELLFDDGAFRDLAARGHWRTLLRETALAPNFHFQRSTQIAWLKHTLLSVWPPPPLLRRLYRWLRPRPSEPPPPWLGPRLRDLWSEPLPQELEPAACLSHTQYFTWMTLTSPLLCRDVDMLGYLAARRGIQLRFPFLDMRLARFVLAVPFEHRLPGGWTKRLLRTALADLLPPEIAQRQWKTTFATPVQQTIQRNLLRYQFLLSDGKWMSAPYVERSGARELLDQLAGDTTGASGWAAWHRAWDILMLEMWLRELESVRWAAPPSGPSCRNRRGIDHGREQVPSYEPPPLLGTAALQPGGSPPGRRTGH